MSQLCQQCHAEIDPQASPIANPAVCPACGAELISRPGKNLDPAGATPGQADHRGILLPRRHAVGGIITPR